MTMSGAVQTPEVYTAREVAAAARRSLAEVQTLIDSGQATTLDGEFLSHAEAGRVVQALRAGRPLGTATLAPSLFTRVTRGRRDSRVPLVASTAVHGSLIGALLLVPLLGRADITAPLSSARVDQVRLVFLATPGPGGGGGGGGLRQPRPAAPARREGRRQLSSPIPPPEPVPEPTPAPAPPPPVPEAPAPKAPVAASPADAETTPGVIEETKATDSRGPGATGGAGSGSGAGLGTGSGDGIGEGTGGGTGGGPYRAGSGIDPPSLLREVKPDYSEEARRRSIEGDVVLEIVVRRDGSVGEIRLLQGLGHGLNERAVQAVRQWRFEPARRRGEAVDVLVEVAVEFKLR